MHSYVVMKVIFSAHINEYEKRRPQTYMLLRWQNLKILGLNPLSSILFYPLAIGVTSAYESIGREKIIHLVIIRTIIKVLKLTDIGIYLFYNI